MAAARATRLMLCGSAPRSARPRRAVLCAGQRAMATPARALTRCRHTRRHTCSGELNERCRSTRRLDPLDQQPHPGDGPRELERAGQQLPGEVAHQCHHSVLADLDRGRDQLRWIDTAGWLGELLGLGAMDMHHEPTTSVRCERELALPYAPPEVAREAPVLYQGPKGAPQSDPPGYDPPGGSAIRTQLVSEPVDDLPVASEDQRKVTLIRQ